jgi:uncharacterized protein (TIGR00369 family)
MTALALDAAGVAAYIAEVWPGASDRYSAETIESLTATSARMRWRVDESVLRPGGTVSGPTMFQLADSVAYLLVLGLLGRAALAVTSHASIDFLRRPSSAELVAEARLLKLGRTQIVMAVDIFTVDLGAEPDPARPVASASLTYSRALVT